MCCLHIVGVIISPRRSHAFGLFMFGHNVVVIREGFVADCAFAVLLNDFAVHQLPHFGWRPKLSISPGVVRIFDALNTQP